MKNLSIAAMASAACLVVAPASAFVVRGIPGVKSLTSSSSSTLQMVLEKPMTKEISKLETLKIKSSNLIHPLKEVRLANAFDIVHHVGYMLHWVCDALMIVFANVGCLRESVPVSVFLSLSK